MIRFDPFWCCSPKLLCLCLVALICWAPSWFVPCSCSLCLGRSCKHQRALHKRIPCGCGCGPWEWHPLPTWTPVALVTHPVAGRTAAWPKIPLNLVCPKEKPDGSAARCHMVLKDSCFLLWRYAPFLRAKIFTCGSLTLEEPLKITMCSTYKEGSIARHGVTLPCF